MHEKDKSRCVKLFKLNNESMKFEVRYLFSLASLILLMEIDIKPGLWQIAEAIPAWVMKGQSNIIRSWRNSQFLHS
jgi:hypothetical protein